MKYLNEKNYHVGYIPFNIDLKNSNKSILILDDGNFFIGRAFGANVTGIGEICFNTSITGYQEIITDPSYTNQIIKCKSTTIHNKGDDFENIYSKYEFMRASFFEIEKKILGNKLKLNNKNSHIIQSIKYLYKVHNLTIKG